MINFYFFLLDIGHTIIYVIFNILGSQFKPKLLERKKFEEKNFSLVACKSFKQDSITADACFEVSSEGELEQIKPIIKMLLLKKKHVEILFCSDSVESQCLKIYEDQPELIRIYRLPLLTYFPWGKNKHTVRNWLTSKNLFLCRYDFFPELMLIGRYHCKFFALLSATLKGKDISTFGFFKAIYWKYIYTSFHFFTTPTTRDKNLLRINFEINNDNIKTIDYRVLQIQHRLEIFDQTLSVKIPGWLSLQKLLDLNRSKILIFGSFWQDEIELFNRDFFTAVSKRELFPILLAHQLDDQTIGKIKLSLKEKQNSAKIYDINKTDSELTVAQVIEQLSNTGGILLINIKGALCELYKYSNLAYVGGGHGRSVHSLLEPYLAGCNIMCGPKIHRSTEYDIIHEKSFDHIAIITSKVDLMGQIKKFQNLHPDIKRRHDYIEDTKIQAYEVDLFLEKYI